jgi:hypothetical protein
MQEAMSVTTPYDPFPWLQCRKSAVGKRTMSWVGIVVAVICLYLAFKVVAFMLKLLLWAIVLGGLYVFLAPMLGMPSPFS